MRCNLFDRFFPNLTSAAAWWILPKNLAGGDEYDWWYISNEREYFDMILKRNTEEAILITGGGAECDEYDWWCISNEREYYDMIMTDTIQIRRKQFGPFDN